MARRKSTKVRTLQPAVMKLNFRVPVTETGNSLANYIDISEAVSRVNRRFYRQGLNWAVKNVKISMLPAADLNVQPAVAYVNTLQHTWTTANAWNKAYHLWKRQQDDAIDETSSQATVARFRDFKVHCDTDHNVKTFADNLDPYTLGPGTVVGALTPGLMTGATVLPSEEWEHSQFVIPNDGAPGVTNEYNFHMVGPEQNLPGNSKGIIEGYALSRVRPHNPDPSAPVVSGSWMQEMFNVGDESQQVTDNAQFHNNELPYDQVEYPGGEANFSQLETQGYVLNASTVGVTTFNTGPFTAPCGLIRLDFAGQTTVNTFGYYNIITVELVPGTHRGYLVETMEEF